MDSPSNISQKKSFSNRSLESSLRSRIVRLEEEHTPFFLGKERGPYWAEMKTSLDQAPSQKEYNSILDFENRDLQIREKKHLVFMVYKHMLMEHPALASDLSSLPSQSKKASRFFSLLS